MQSPADPPAPGLETITPADSIHGQEGTAPARKFLDPRLFGIWPDVEDGLTYQERMRSEWKVDVDG
jgi:hypothetical protein